MATSPLAISRYFTRLRDPRRRHLRRHLLIDIIVIALCAVICGANDWQEIATFGKRRRCWLQTFLTLPNGIPSHDTFERVFDRIAPDAFLACFQQWVEALAHGLGLEHIAIDGKALRHSGAAAKGLRPLHVVSAWATQCHLSLGQVAVDAKSNEITAIPRLLELLDLHGALVTIDAMGCQKEIAKKVVAGGGDYVLAVKDNQPHLLEDIQEVIGQALESNFEGYRHDLYETVERGHGREETRSYLILTEPEGIRDQELWTGLKVVGMCMRTRVVNGEQSDETHYFIGSRAMGAQGYAEVVRGHWGIENNLHWQLDIVFGEDGNRVQRRNGAENLSQLRRMALGLLKRHPEEESIKCKRLSAALDTDFLEEILLAGCNLGKG
ncbi:MAG TPA: ISAs1 family transposase [Gemmataceae bacterium]|nr:ISAs1 family transposase [Gemmataceae bacterium]